ncbi:MAG: BatA domain-containing protein [Flavobacteriales bacterium]|nr:BatA domain-containing protein [Flavobacteriales bacterium]
MSFAYPLFLVALVSIAIPIIIHLFNFQKTKKVYFTNVKYLFDVKQKSRKRNNIKHFLVLLSRILAICALVLAFAQPFWPEINVPNAAKFSNLINIYIDNSFSMQGKSESSVLLETAKLKAIEIVNGRDQADRFQLLTNDYNKAGSTELDKNEILEKINKVVISPKVKPFSEIIARQNDVLNEYGSKSKISYLISDCQKNTFNLDETEFSEEVSYHLIPLHSEFTNNILIDSCWFSSPIRQPNTILELQVRLKNLSDDDSPKVPLKLMINGIQKSLASVSIGANGSAIATLSFTSGESGIQECEVAIEDFPISFDNTYFFSFKINEQLDVLCINETDENNYIANLYATDEVFNLTNSSANQIDLFSLSKYDMVILNELNRFSSGLISEIKKHVEQGGSLLLVPSDKIDLDSYSECALALNINAFKNVVTDSIRVGQINTEHEIYEGVFESIPNNINLPMVRISYPLNESELKNNKWLLKLENGVTVLSSFDRGKGRIYLSGAPFNMKANDLVKHALFVPTLYRMGLNSQASGMLSHIIGKTNAIEIDHLPHAEKDIFHIKNDNFDIIPEHRVVNTSSTIYPGDLIKKAGNYQLTSDSNKIGLSFNYNRAESAIEAYEKSELTSLAKDLNLPNFKVDTQSYSTLGSGFSDLANRRTLWKLCIIFAIVFFAIETLLLRYWKTENE